MLSSKSLDINYKIKHTLDIIENYCNESKDLILIVGINDKHNYEVYKTDYIGQFKQYSIDICREASKERVLCYIFTNSYNNFEKEYVINQLKTYQHYLNSFCVCANEHTKQLKLSTRKDN